MPTRADCCASATFVSCSLAALFVFFSLVAFQGVLLNLLPAGQFARISLAMQGTLLLVLLCGLPLVFSIPNLQNSMNQRPDWLVWAPPAWFLGLHQVMAGNHEPMAAQLARISLSGVVTAIVSERTGLQRVEVDGEKAYVLTQLVGPVAVGDRVVMNTTAVELGLGTGGSHVVHWNLARESWAHAGPGHIMKLRYTSLQVDTGAAEELGPFDPASGLAGTASGSVVARINPFGIPDNPTYVAGGLAADGAGNVYYNAIALNRNDPWGSDVPGSWLVRIASDGTATKAAFSSLVPDAPSPGAFCQTSFSANLPWPPSPDPRSPSCRANSERS